MTRIIQTNLHSLPPAARPLTSRTTDRVKGMYHLFRDRIHTAASICAYGKHDL
jgi:hypothetical protein